LHRDFARYFGIAGSVACFHYDFIAPNTVLMPSQQISYDDRAQQQWLVEEIEQLIEVRPTGVLSALSYDPGGCRKPLNQDHRLNLTSQTDQLSGDTTLLGFSAAVLRKGKLSS
jgi:hypothetical protein